MANQSKHKQIREMLAFLEGEFRSHKIKEYVMRPTPNGHIIISFNDHNHKPRALTIAGSSDNKARLRNRSILRQMLEGRT